MQRLGLPKVCLMNMQHYAWGSYNGGVFTQTAGREYIDNEVDYIIDVATSIIAQDSNIAFATGTHKVETFANKTVLKGGR